jgi:hypothetical protein
VQERSRCGWSGDGNREVMRDFGNADESGFGLIVEGHVVAAAAGETRALRLVKVYSRTLSSSFFLPQSAAAWTKARTSGCGFFSVDESWGWKRVATKKR